MSIFRATIKVEETVTQGWDTDTNYHYVYEFGTTEREARNKASFRIEDLSELHRGDFSIHLNIVTCELLFIEEIEPEIVLRKLL